MANHRHNIDPRAGSAQPGNWTRRFRRDRDGGVAIEFAILAIPFFLLVFAIIETCVAFAAEQTLNYAVDKLGRQLRTGQITFNTGESTDITEQEFKTEFCKELSIMIACGKDVDTRLFIDLKSYASFGAMPTKVPRKAGTWGDLDTTGFTFNPGGSASINMFRAFYKWKVTADLVRPYITNIREDGSTPEYYLIVSTTAYRNEAYE
ncbi:MAG: pilus assembly protein [Alphaproteobacteria bacterium]|nr:pilus assembly protein [Alphaproteobacteria bacterium]